MKLLCFGDLHLGQGAQYPGRLADQERVLEQIFQLARDRQVDGMLFAGDLFEGPGITPEQLDVFIRPFERLYGEIPLLAINGNSRHDLAVREVNALAPLRHVPGILIASAPYVHAFAGCAVATLPWVHPGRLIARAGRDVPRDEVNRIAAELLVDVARGLREDCDRVDGPKILLGHWSVSGTALPAGLPVDELREPVLSADALDELSYDALVFGHIHRAQGIGTSHDRHILFDDDGVAHITYGNATAVYTGSPMPLNFGEAQGPHGVWILEPENPSTKSTFVPIESPRFITIDLGSNADVDWQLGHSIADAVGGDTDQLHDAIIRVRFTATTEQMQRIDLAQIREPLLQVARVVKIEPMIVRAQRARVAGADEQLDELAALELWIEATSYDGDSDALRSRARDLLEATT